MRKILLTTLLIGTLSLVGCGNKQILDMTYTYNKAIITTGGETIEIDVESWTDYDDTSIQIKDKSGKIYLTDLKNVLLIKE